jgi:hypothetical protein
MLRIAHRCFSNPGPFRQLARDFSGISGR